MSAYQCSPDHIAQLAALLTTAWRPGESAIVGWAGLDPNRTAYEQVFAALWLANDRSVSYRYRTPVDPTSPAAPAAWANVDVLALMVTTPDFAARVIKAAHCYSYQACELDSWATSREAQWMESLISLATSKLPGYSAAPWGAPFASPTTDVVRLSF